MKTINIKGKEYERVKEFHKLYPDGEIYTEIVSNDDKKVVVKATIKFDKWMSTPVSSQPFKEVTFTGHSQAEWGKGMRGNVALEVAETSAVGRALGFAGIGIDTGIASADEI